MIKQLNMQKVSRRAASVVFRQSGFTLVEIMIVVIILGILASIVLPAFSNANVEAKEAMLKEDVRIMRTQIGTYMVQHNDIPPGYPVVGGVPGEPTEAVFIEQMTKYTNIDGEANDTKTNEYCYGPYMREISKNSVSNLSAVEVIADGADMPAAPPDEVGWVYKPETLTWRAGNPGEDLSGRPFYGY